MKRAVQASLRLGAEGVRIIVQEGWVAQKLPGLSGIEKVVFLFIL